MKRFYKLDLFDAGESRQSLLRNAIANYLKCGDAYEFMGIGFTKLDENPGAKSESEVFINEVTASASITSYETEFPYDSRLIPNQKPVMALWKTGRNHDTGDAAQFKYVVLELFNPIGEPTAETAEYTAREFTVVNEVSSTTGNGGEKIQVSGTLKAAGDPIQGKFNTVTKTFTAGTFKGKYDEEPAAAG